MHKGFFAYQKPYQNPCPEGPPGGGLGSSYRGPHHSVHFLDSYKKGKLKCTKEFLLTELRTDIYVRRRTHLNLSQSSSHCALVRLVCLGKLKCRMNALLTEYRVRRRTHPDLPSSSSDGAFLRLGEETPVDKAG